MKESASLSSLSVRSTDTLAPSGSFQSHLSHRVRPPAHARNSSISFGPFSAMSEPKTYTTMLATAARKHLVPPAAPLDASLDAAAARAPLVFASSASAAWMLYVYAFVSLVFFSAAAYSVLDASWGALSHSDAGDRSTPGFSHLSALSTSARLAKLSSISPLPLAFDLFFFSGSLATTVSDKPTACLWTHDEDLDWIAPWTTDWDGPISLVVTSRSARQGRLRALLLSPHVNASKLAVHVVQLHPASTPAPNALLNLARLFAPSPYVLLVPGKHGPLPAIPRSGTYNGTAPTIVTPASAPVFPYAPLAPVLIPRAHDVWCTERFFAHPFDTRAADWAECVWQLHLDGLRAAVSPDAAITFRASAEHARAPATIDTVIHRRMTARFRAESCVLALKRRELLVDAGLGGDGERTRWIERECRAWLTEGSAARSRSG